MQILVPTTVVVPLLFVCVYLCVVSGVWCVWCVVCGVWCVGGVVCVCVCVWYW